MGEIFVKKNNAFERVVSDGNTVIVTGGGGGGGGGVTIAFYAHRNEQDGDNGISSSVTTGFPSDGQEGSGQNSILLRNLSKYLDGVVTNTSSISGQPFDSDTGEFTAQVAGVYRFSATVGVYAQAGNNTNDGFSLWIRKNGSLSQVTNRNSNRVGMLYKVVNAGSDSNDPVPRLTAQQTWEIELAVGDKIVLWGGWGESFSGFPIVYDASFSGSYVGGASVTPVNPIVVSARVTVDSILNETNNTTGSTFNAGFFGGGTPIIEDLDPSNCFDPQTGVFTAPVSGDYSIGFSAAVANVTTSGPGNDIAFNFDVWIQKTPAGQALIASDYSHPSRIGAIFTDGASAGGLSLARRCGSSNTWLVRLNAGDSIRWHGRAWPAASTTTIQNFVWKVNLLTSTQTINEEQLFFHLYTNNPNEFYTQNQQLGQQGFYNGIGAPSLSESHIWSSSESGVPAGPGSQRSMCIVTGGDSQIVSTCGRVLNSNMLYVVDVGQGNNDVQLPGTIVEVVDTHNALDSNNCRFTAPFAGWYELTARLQSTSTPGYGPDSVNYLWLEKNNTDAYWAKVDMGSRHTQSGNANNLSHLIGHRTISSDDFNELVVSHMVYLSQGETVVPCCYTGMIFNWAFSGKLLRKA